MHLLHGGFSYTEGKFGLKVGIRTNMGGNKACMLLLLRYLRRMYKI